MKILSAHSLILVQFLNIQSLNTLRKQKNENNKYLLPSIWNRNVLDIVTYTIILNLRLEDSLAKPQTKQNMFQMSETYTALDMALDNEPSLRCIHWNHTWRADIHTNQTWRAGIHTNGGSLQVQGRWQSCSLMARGSLQGQVQGVGSRSGEFELCTGGRD